MGDLYVFLGTLFCLPYARCTHLIRIQFRFDTVADLYYYYYCYYSYYYCYYYYYYYCYYY